MNTKSKIRWRADDESQSVNSNKDTEISPQGLYLTMTAVLLNAVFGSLSARHVESVGTIQITLRLRLQRLMRGTRGAVSTVDSSKKSVTRSGGWRLTLNVLTHVNCGALSAQWWVVAVLLCQGGARRRRRDTSVLWWQSSGCSRLDRRCAAAYLHHCTDDLSTRRLQPTVDGWRHHCHSSTARQTVSARCNANSDAKMQHWSGTVPYRTL